MSKIEIRGLSPLEIAILEEVKKNPGIAVATVSDTFYPEYSITWSREVCRRLALRGKLRLEHGHQRKVFAYPVDPDAAACSDCGEACRCRQV